MASQIFIRANRVALKEDTKYRGAVLEVHAGYNHGDPTMYNVAWDKGVGTYLYLAESLVLEKDVPALVNNDVKKA